ncbi:hypothetical protein [Roseobacter denitrificans]|uniref:Uncharacterized protein n=1 Tax=Roseobacter denitrificans (strain ATCC 33942 / OCh 114) TaxID=375451 RepID=Q164T2_ROSDO|nr:hypothetical protein [Roseobacter denitrificans]ABG32511.1 hypothetical protein RD1_2992 [Roseobacter denitrificans OCh 114]SFF82845.1 hypothetical protein SAMN05443635_102478 [Roseobacter denitrificans OCh 114]
MEQQETTEVNVRTLAQRLRSDVTLTAPAWVFALGGFAVLVLIGVALD